MRMSLPKEKKNKKQKTVKNSSLINSGPPWEIAGIIYDKTETCFFSQYYLNCIQLKKK